MGGAEREQRQGQDGRSRHEQAPFATAGRQAPEQRGAEQHDAELHGHPEVGDRLEQPRDPGWIDVALLDARAP